MNKIIEDFIFSFEYGGFGSDNHKIYNQGIDLNIEINHQRLNSEEFNHLISLEQWDKFWKVIDDLDAWRWDKDYFNQDILDGTQWELVIDRKGKRKRRIFGSNSYPPNFKLLINAINNLAGTDIEHYDEG